MHKIYLDTSFILTSIKYKIDMFSEIKRICNFRFKLYAVDKTLEELKNKKEGKLGLKLIENLDIKKTENNKNVDKSLIEIAKREKIIVATQDKYLKKRLRDEGALIITIRQRGYLVLGG